jgi:hypothetical protein
MLPHSGGKRPAKTTKQSTNQPIDLGVVGGKGTKVVTILLSV